jgi:autotransporter-associated beta strand protein
VVSTPEAAQAQTSTWGGAGSGTTTSDYNLGTNWSNPPAGAPPVNAGQTATFSTTGNATVNVTAGPITPDSWTFTATPAGSYTITGSAVNFNGAGPNLVNNDGTASDTISISNNMSGAGLSQAAASTLTLTGTNTFTAVNITAGTLALSGGGSIAGSSLVTVGNGSGNATLDISGTTSGASVQSLTGASDGAVKLGNQTLTITAGAAAPFYGAINGSGGLTMAGGFIQLGGANGYTGVTTINSGADIGLLGSNTIASSSKVILDGTLDLSVTLSGSSIKSLSGTTGMVWMGSGIALTITAANDTFAGSIGATAGDAGSLVLSGGTEKLTGTSHYSGATTINGGTLEVDGTIATSSGVTVNAGGTLSGVGSVGNTQVNSGGTFAPGAGVPGPMSVAGNLAFQSGAIYLVQVNPSTASSAAVTGTATLAGATVNAAFASGSYVAKQYTILTAGSVNGAFGTLVNSNLPKGFQTSLSYDGTHAYLDLALGFGPSSSPNFGGGLSANQQAVGNALVNSFNANGGIPLVFGTATPAGLTQLSGESATGSQQTTFDAMGQFMGVLTDPTIAGRGDPVSAGGSPNAYADEGMPHGASVARSKSERDAYATMYAKAPVASSFEQRWSVWAAGFGGSQTTNGNAASVGSQDTSSRLYGTAVGADYRISPDMLAGVALAGGGTSFSVNNLGSGRSDLFQAGAFVRHNFGQAYLTGALAYGWQDITTDRIVTVAGLDHLRAEFNANAWSGRLEGGYRFVTQGFGVTPYAAAQFVTFDLPSYMEQAIVGANTFALAYNAKSVTDTRSELGIRTDKSFAMADGIFTLRGRFAWAHDFDPDRSVLATFQTLPGASFVVNGAAHASDSALTTASAEWTWMRGWSLAATFEGEFSPVTTSYAGKGAVRFAW